MRKIFSIITKMKIDDTDKWLISLAAGILLLIGIVLSLGSHMLAIHDGAGRITSHGR